VAERPEQLSLDELFAQGTVGPDERPRAVRDAGGEAHGPLAALDLRGDPGGPASRVLQTLDEEVTNAIGAREHSLRPPASLQETNFAEYVGQMNMAHLMAEEAVLAEMVYLPPEPGLESEAGEPEIGTRRGFIDRGWKPPS
jgi:hypothetical protein